MSILIYHISSPTFCEVLLSSEEYLVTVTNQLNPFICLWVDGGESTKLMGMNVTKNQERPAETPFHTKILGADSKIKDQHAAKECYVRTSW